MDIIAGIITALIAVLGVGAFMFVVIAFFSVYNAWILSTLWGWFIVPIFGLAALTIPQAIGVSLVVSCFTYRPPKKDADTKATAQAIGSSVLGKLLLLAVGYVVKEWFLV